MKNDGGRTALHYAASKGWLKIAELLISNGAKLNTKDKVSSLMLSLIWTSELYNIVLFFFQGVLSFIYLFILSI